MTDTTIDKVAADEVWGYILNTMQMYNQLESIQKNLVNKMAAGKYDSKLAPKIFIYLIENGDKGYQKVFGSKRSGFLLNVATRKYLAIEMEKDFYKDAIAGEFKHLLFKKYSGEENLSDSRQPFTSAAKYKKYINRMIKYKGQTDFINSIGYKKPIIGQHSGEYLIAGRYAYILSREEFQKFLKSGKVELFYKGSGVLELLK